jgi:hypothetical protein
MIAWDIARQWQARHSITPFEEVLGWHLSCGLVHSTPSVFLLAHQVSWNPCAKEVVQGFPNAWFVALTASDRTIAMRDLLALLPRSEFVLWHRQAPPRPQRLHAHRYDALAKASGLVP